MKIKLSIKRDGGSRIDMPNDGAPDTTYHFAPNQAGDHVAEVAKEEHIAMFLCIPEYTPYGDLPPDDAALVSILTEATTATASAATALSTTVDDGAQTADEDDEEADPLPLEQMDRVQLLAVFETVMGERAHPRAGIDLLRSRIAEKIQDDEAAKALFDAEALRLGKAVFAA